MRKIAVFTSATVLSVTASLVLPVSSIIGGGAYMP
jgi:hypothetical protein